MEILAGLLTLFIGIAHSIYGEKVQIKELLQQNNSELVIGSTRIMIHQGGLLLVLVGVLQCMSAIGVVELVGIAEFFPMAIILNSFIVFLIITIGKHRVILKETIPQIGVFLLILFLQYMVI